MLMYRCSTQLRVKYTLMCIIAEAYSMPLIAVLLAYNIQ